MCKSRTTHNNCLVTSKFSTNNIVHMSHTTDNFTYYVANLLFPLTCIHIENTFCHAHTFYTLPYSPCPHIDFSEGFQFHYWINSKLVNDEPQNLPILYL